MIQVLLQLYTEDDVYRYSLYSINGYEDDYGDWYDISDIDDLYLVLESYESATFYATNNDYNKEDEGDGEAPFNYKYSMIDWYFDYEYNNSHDEFFMRWTKSTSSRIYERLYEEFLGIIYDEDDYDLEAASEDKIIDEVYDEDLGDSELKLKDQKDVDNEGEAEKELKIE